MQRDKKYTFDEIIAMLPDKSNNLCLLDKFITSLTFIGAQNSFNVVDMQRYLKIGYGDTARIIDALVLLGVIKKSEGTPTKYVVRKSASVEVETEVNDVED